MRWKHLFPGRWATAALLTAAALLAPTFACADDPAQDAELVETRTEVPRLKAPAPYEMKGDTIEVELAEYAGYAGLIVANGGLEPSDQSVFFKKHGFKVKF